MINLTSFFFWEDRWEFDLDIVRVQCIHWCYLRMCAWTRQHYYDVMTHVFGFSYLTELLILYFLFRSWFDEIGFLYDFNSNSILRILFDEFVASGESSLTKEFGFNILSNLASQQTFVLNHCQILMCWVRK